MADNDVVLVTGASTGFGRLISVTLPRRGSTVFGSMRDIAGRNRSHAADLEERQRQETLRLSVVELDVTDDLSVRQAVERVMRDAGKIDVLVNNAGISGLGLTSRLRHPPRSRRRRNVLTWPDYSKIRLRVKSEAPFAPFVTARSSAPLSSSKTQPPLRATIAPIRPKPATLSPGAAVRIAPSILSQTRSA